MAAEQAALQQSPVAVQGPPCTDGGITASAAVRNAAGAGTQQPASWVAMLAMLAAVVACTWAILALL